MLLLILRAQSGHCGLRLPLEFLVERAVAFTDFLFEGHCFGASCCDCPLRKAADSVAAFPAVDAVTKDERFGPAARSADAKSFHVGAPLDRVLILWGFEPVYKGWIELSHDLHRVTTV